MNTSILPTITMDDIPTLENQCSIMRITTKLGRVIELTNEELYMLKQVTNDMVSKNLRYAIAENWSTGMYEFMKAKGYKFTEEFNTLNSKKNYAIFNMMYIPINPIFVKK